MKSCALIKGKGNGEPLGEGRSLIQHKLFPAGWKRESKNWDLNRQNHTYRKREKEPSPKNWKRPTIRTKVVSSRNRGRQKGGSASQGKKNISGRIGQKNRSKDEGCSVPSNSACSTERLYKRKIKISPEWRPKKKGRSKRIIKSESKPENCIGREGRRNMQKCTRKNHR